VLIMLDPDTLPIMGSVKAAQIAVAKDFRDTLMLSATETAEYFGMDIEDRKERGDVWIDRKYVNVTNPEINQKFMPQPRDAAKPKNEQAKPKKPAASGKKSALPPEQKAAAKAINKAMRRVRRLTLDAIDAGEVWMLAEGDACTDGSETGKRAVRIVRHRVKPIIAAGDKAAAREFFNKLDATELAAA